MLDGDITVGSRPGVLGEANQPHERIVVCRDVGEVTRDALSNQGADRLAATLGDGAELMMLLGVEHDLKWLATFHLS